MSQETVVLDASPMLNILGSGSPQLILTSFAGACLVEENTLKEIQRDPFDGGPALPIIERLIASACLRVTRMGSAAYEHYLELVASDSVHGLGRGESAALAYANEIGAIVVLDDRKARRIGKMKFPKCIQWTSVELFKRGLRASGIPKNQTADLVRFAIGKARMHISPEDREWLTYLGL